MPGVSQVQRRESNTPYSNAELLKNIPFLCGYKNKPCSHVGRGIKHNENLLV